MRRFADDLDRWCAGCHRQSMREPRPSVRNVNRMLRPHPITVAASLAVRLRNAFADATIQPHGFWPAVLIAKRPRFVTQIRANKDPQPHAQ